ncbi:hypothetical protein E3U43_015466 [Larimichthys crocea]|uniref:Uncharacterized protein n=1 Tax=Larimichthys crocea TaxID=215358 RepID=A0ACD3RPZ2_LARCR|nr:hypothetical protein E3U43_015466 [Larimichthys crocea]
MIGSLLFYALYPLSRYLSGRQSEASKKDPPPAVVNGTAVWDGGVIATKKFTQSQTALLDQWVGQSSGTKRETKERMTDPSVEKEDLDKKQLMAALHEEPENSKMSEAVKESEAEAGNAPQQDKLEAPKQEDILKITFEKTEDGNNFPTEELTGTVRVPANRGHVFKKPPVRCRKTQRYQVWKIH